MKDCIKDLYPGIVQMDIVHYNTQRLIDRNGVNNREKFQRRMVEIREKYLELTQ